MYYKKVLMDFILDEMARQMTDDLEMSDFHESGNLIKSNCTLSDLWTIVIC